MSKQTLEEWFREMVPKAAKLHALTWCVKRSALIPTITLTYAECWECSEFVLNKGICDPL